MNRNSLSRRSFLSASAAGLGLVAQGMPARRVLGASQRVRIGMIGLGGRGSDLFRMVLRRAGDQNDVEVAALCDVYRKRLNAAAEHAPEAKTYLHHQELLERNDLDAVFIATPDHWHAPLTLAAMQSGKDVYCEKPMTLHWEDAKEVARQARELNRVLQIGVQALSWSKWYKVKEIVDRGMLGKIVICQ
ncbi:MAG TPA: Gfo/Idh/MocA family oxidoreductase, partial [bacterium]|nr:Gfo/Idh/MocA family oxidoreductase [bacterium]